MRHAVPLTVLLCVSTVGACGSGSETLAGTATGVQVEAQRRVLVTNEPLGDVVSDELDAGDQVTALCFVRAAQTNTGARGTAIKIKAGRRSGYAPTTDFPVDPSQRSMTFDAPEDELRERLPACQ